MPCNVWMLNLCKGSEASHGLGAAGTDFFGASDCAPLLTSSLTLALFSLTRLLRGAGSSLMVMCPSLRGDAYCASVLGDDMVNVRRSGRRDWVHGGEFVNVTWRQCSAATRLKGCEESVQWWQYNEDVVRVSAYGRKLTVAI